MRQRKVFFLFLDFNRLGLFLAPMLTDSRTLYGSGVREIDFC